MRKLLKILFVIISVQAILFEIAAAAVGLLYWSNPDKFMDKFRSYYNPGLNAELVTTNEPEPSTSDVPGLGATAVGLGASPRETTLISALSVLITRNPPTALAHSAMVEAMLPFTPAQQRRVLIYLP